MESKNELIGQLKTETVVSIDKKIEDRFKQSNPSRLAEYMTGLKPDNLRMVDRLIEDQKIIRAKYGLPDLEYIANNLSEYETFLINKAKDNGIVVRNKGDSGKSNEILCSGFFSNESNLIVININKTDKKKYFDSLLAFEHETIHSLQYKHYQEMGIEQQEYEAYVACLDLDNLRKNSEETIEDLFGSSLHGMYYSINHWYKETSEETGNNIGPIWNNSEFFLKNIDGINGEQIKEYIDRIIKFRFEQPKIDRLCEYITGLRLDDSKLIDKLEKDRLEIISKYNLPSRDLVFNNPEDYEGDLKQLAEKNGIRIKPKDEYINYLNRLKLDEKYKLETAYADKILFFDFNKLNNEEKYIENLHNFEHGILRILQGFKGIEARLYEDCLLDLNFNELKNNKNELYAFFENISDESISYFKEKKMLPYWMNPENLLRETDRISKKQIEDYKDKHRVIDTQK